VLNEQIDALEDKIVSSFGRIDYSMRPELSSYRRRIIELRRYMAPQRDALSRLAQMDRFHWLTEVDRFHFMEISDRTIRGVEDLDEARDRATVIQETLASRISEQVEQRMYILSMVAAIFLPLTFVTGLLGTNIGGIPGSTTSWAFFAVSAFLVGVAVIEYWIFKRKRWM
jgi:zinc transporter